MLTDLLSQRKLEDKVIVHFKFYKFLKVNDAVFCFFHLKG